MFIRGQPLPACIHDIAEHESLLSNRTSPRQAWGVEAVVTLALGGIVLTLGVIAVTGFEVRTNADSAIGVSVTVMSTLFVPSIGQVGDFQAVGLWIHV